MRGQRRGRSIAMSAEERDSFLDEQHTCRLATVGTGGPHVSPVWFVWDGQALWVYSLTRSQRWANLQRDPRAAVVIDAGHHYHELRGVEIEGEAVVTGPVPRTDDEDPETPELADPERRMAGKYFGGATMTHDGRHAWLRITPLKIVSWDFRKLADLPARPATLPAHAYPCRDTTANPTRREPASPGRFRGEILPPDRSGNVTVRHEGRPAAASLGPAERLRMEMG